MNKNIFDKSDPSIPEDLNIQVAGIEEDIAYEVGNFVMATVREYSRCIPLENLEAITISTNYKQALASVARGFSCHPEAALPTEDEEVGIGVAMALPVLKNEVWKTHIVFGPAIVGMYLDKEGDGLKSALNLIAHELGHVVDHHFKAQAFGNIINMRCDELVPDPLQRFLWELSHHIWDEYCANRICALLTSCGTGENDLFLDACGSYKNKIREFRIKYHKKEINLSEFLGFVKHYIYLSLMATGYLLGLDDGIEGESLMSIEATELLHSSESRELLAFKEPLLTIWGKNGKWQSYDDFLVLNEPTLKLLNSLELYPSILEDGSLYMEVPVRI